MTVRTRRNPDVRRDLRGPAEGGTVRRVVSEPRQTPETRAREDRRFYRQRALWQPRHQRSRPSTDLAADLRLPASASSIRRYLRASTGRSPPWSVQPLRSQHTADAQSGTPSETDAMSNCIHAHHVIRGVDHARAAAWQDPPRRQAGALADATASQSAAILAGAIASSPCLSDRC
jgi:hypothetical protein